MCQIKTIHRHETKRRQGTNMPDNRQTVINIDQLATSLQREFENLYPLSDECCIYRVPRRMRQLHEEAYTPKAVSIGPLHHGRDEFKVMEEHKKRYLQAFLGRTQVSMHDLLTLIRNNETRLRDCYAETIEILSEEFVKMILLDAAFLIELLLRYRYHGLITRDDRMHKKPWMIQDIIDDLFLLENQLPMFILEDLFKLAKPKIPPPCPATEVIFIKLTVCFWKETCANLLIDENLLESHFREARHFVDLLRLCLQPSENCERNKLKSLTTPTITELYHSGVQFKLRSSNNLFDIRFENGILEIPKLRLYAAQTEILLRNLQQFETLHSETNYLNDYITMMNYLVNTPKDVEVLMKAGIIENWLGNTGEMPKLFINILKDCSISPSNFYYSGLIEDLNAHCNISRHKWKATLKQDYFNTPWASISVIAAITLLLLTLLQTIFTVVSP